MKKLGMGMLLVACVSACTNPGETTGVGAATGGALGATVGGLIGSQTGDPGAGFLLGGVTGASAGAAIGNFAQYKDEQILSRDEEIARQQRLIATQEREITELRRASRDQVAFNGATSSALTLPDYRSGNTSQVLPQNTLANKVAPNFAGEDLASGQTVNSNPSNSWSNDFAPRFDNQAARIGVNKESATPPALALNTYDPVAKNLEFTPPSQTSNAEMLSRNQQAQPRFSAKLEPISRGYFGADANTKTSPTASANAALTSSATSITKTEPALEAKAETPVLSAGGAISSGAATSTGTYSKSFSTGAFAMDSKATTSQPSGDALSFSKLEELKKEDISSPAPDVAPKSVVTPDTEPVALPQKSTPVIASKTETTTTSQMPNAQALNSSMSPECQDASKEVQSAVSANELPDKLFHYRRALRLCPTNSAYHVGLGKVYLSMERKDDAKFEFEEALRLDANNAEARAELGKIK